MRRRLGRVAFAIMMTCALEARAQPIVLEPTARIGGDGPKAIQQGAAAEARQALNANTVTVMTGTIGGTYVQFGADLATVLDDGNQLRILPVVGQGSVQNVEDILYLQGVDLGIVRADTFDYMEKKGLARNLRKQFTYVTKLYHEEMNVVAPKSIRSLRELDGKSVSIDLPNGGTFVTAQIVFERLGIRPKFVYLEQRIALEKLKGGELDAVVSVQGKPSPMISQINDDRLHLVPINYDDSLQSDYLPASLTAKDYPNLISDQEQVDTIAVPSVLAAYNWPPTSARFRKLAMFVDAFFTKFPAFQNPPFHPKWNEVSLSAPVPGWRRFVPAQQWLDSHKVAPVARVRFDEFLKQDLATPGRLTPDADGDDLFNKFKAWEAEQSTRDPAPPVRKRQSSTLPY